MTTKAAVVRQHVHLDEELSIWTCNQCFVEGKSIGKTYRYTGGTSNIVRHFEEFHSEMFQEALGNVYKMSPAVRKPRTATPKRKPQTEFKQEVVIGEQVGRGKLIFIGANFLVIIHE